MTSTFKKWFSRIVLGALTIGASSALGFGSFVGIYVLAPIVGLAVLGFILTVSYDAEIYYQNLKDTFLKIFQFDYIHRFLTKRFLLENLIKITQGDNPPQFFKTYEAELHLSQQCDVAYEKALKIYNKARYKDALTEDQKKRLEEAYALKKMQNKKLKEMEKMLSIALFSKSKNKELADWIENNERAKAYKGKLLRKTWAARIALGFSVIAGVCMGMATTFLILDSLSTLGVLAFIVSSTNIFIPVLVAASVVIFLAGAAYVLLTYNAITDIINHEIIQNRYKQIQEAKGWKKALKILTVLGLIGIAVVLTIFTAGTWWTIGRNIADYFSANRIFSQIMGHSLGRAAPAVFAVSNMAANTYNADETLTMAEKYGNGILYTESEKSVFVKLKKSYKHYEAENFLQWINPFRILIGCIGFIRNVFLFITYHISIAVDSDLNRPSEEPNTEEGWIWKGVKYIITPLYLLASGWDWILSKINWNKENRITLEQAIEKQYSEESSLPLIKSGIEKKLSKQNFMQFINPFALLIQCILLPARMVLFVMHIIAESADSDQMTGVAPELMTAFDSAEHFTGELHYFVGDEHDHVTYKNKSQATQALLNDRLERGAGHSHESDNPTKILKLSLCLVYGLAIVWDYVFSQFNSGNKEPLTWEEAYIRQTQNEHDHCHANFKYKNEDNREIQENVENWQVEHICLLIDKHVKTHLANSKDSDKLSVLDTLVSQLKDKPKEIKTLLTTAKENVRGILANGLFSTEKSKTEQFLEKLSLRFNQ